MRRLFQLMTMIARRLHPSLVVLALLGADGPARAGVAPVETHPSDRMEIDRLSPRYPHVVELIRQAEAAQSAGDVSTALARLKQADGEYPYSPLVARRRCEVLTALGQQTEAVTMCRTAMQLEPSPWAVQAMVRALLAGSSPPTPTTLVQAMQLGAIERRRHPDDPWGYESLCEVGERIGDRTMLQTCSEELLRIAPDDPTLHRVQTELRPARWIIGAWLLIAASVIGTLAHAAWSALSRARRRAARVASAAALALTFLAVARSASAAEPPASGANTAGVAAAAAANPSAVPSGNPSNDLSEWQISDDLPEANIPTQAMQNKNPLEFGYWLQDLTSRGLKASDRGDHAQAIKYFRALAKAVPDRAVAFSKLCAEYAAAGHRDEAIATCSAALVRPGVRLIDYGQFVYVVLDKPGELSEKELAAVNDAVTHVREDPNGGADAAREFECDIAVKRRDAATLSACAAELSAKAPGGAKTQTYVWALAMVQGRYADARQAIERAKSTAIKPEAVDRMEHETDRAESTHRKRVLLGSIGGGLALLAIVAVITARRRPLKGAIAASAAFALVSLTSTSGGAQTPTADARAQTLFEAARQLRDGGQVADACAMFAESQKLSPGVGVTLYLGDCYERMGRSASAWQEFRRAEGRARDRHDDKRADIARGRADALEPTLRRLTILASPVAHDGWQVLVDGSVVPPAMWNTALALDPGEHTVAVEVPGQPPRLLYARLDAAHASEGVRIDEPAAVPSSPAGVEASEGPPPSPLAPAEPPSQGASPVRTWVTVALTAVGLVGVGLGVEFVVKRNKLINDCTPCDTPQNEDETAAAAAIAFSAGGAALVSALALVLSAPAQTPSTGSRSGTRTGLVWAPTMMPGGAGAVFGGAF
ncbi:MAG TPA: hypothetical protein VGM06_09680 [Polyangiaceae bacterium]|jgi:tetratricopeptide (TPR) repeat protein